ncbi:hypothetical protein COOONC_02113 [Cooperia oncophora]
MLDRKLLLIVRQRFGQENYKSPWILPQLKHESGETLRETAERCLRQVADDIKASFYGNAPFAVFSHKYPKPLSAVRLEKDGAKIFFLNAVLDSSSSFAPNKEEVADYKWVVREEFWSTVPCKKYKLCVNSVDVGDADETTASRAGSGRAYKNCHGNPGKHGFLGIPSSLPGFPVRRDLLLQLSSITYSAKPHTLDSYS